MENMTPTTQYVMQLAKQCASEDVLEGEWACGRYPEAAQAAMREMGVLVEDFVLDFVELLIDRIEQQQDMIARSGMDISPCQICGEPVVCLPDGLPMCESCAEAEADR